MQRGRSIRLLSELALVLALAASSPAFADDDEAKAKFDAAEAAYDVGDFDRARRLYVEAYELKPLPGFLFNIGQCHKKLGEWNKAAFYYRRYLARLPEGTDDSKLQALIAEMDAKVVDTPAPEATAVSAAPVAPAREPDRPRAAPRLVPAAASATSAALTPPPLVVRDNEPLYRQWWVWTTAGAVTVAAVATIVAVGVVNSERGPSDPKYGKLDAR